MHGTHICVHRGVEKFGSYVVNNFLFYPPMADRTLRMYYGPISKTTLYLLKQNTEEC